MDFEFPPKKPPTSPLVVRPSMAMPQHRPAIIPRDLSEAYISEEKKEKPKRKNGPLFFSIALFLMIAIFVVLIGWYEFKNNDNSLEKLLSKNNGATEKTAKLETDAKTSDANAVAAAKAAAAKAAQQKQADLADAESINTGATNPVETTDSADEEKETYKNEKEGISFDYAKEYKIEENNGQIVAKKSDAMWRMKIYDNKDKKEIQGWFDGYFSGKDNEDCVLSDPSALKIGTLATKLSKAGTDSGKCEGVGYYALNSDKTKTVRVRLDKADEAEANKILSTFKFLK
jgi:hypothetical protein